MAFDVELLYNSGQSLNSPIGLRYVFVWPQAHLIQQNYVRVSTTHSNSIERLRNWLSMEEWVISGKSVL